MLTVPIAHAPDHQMNLVSNLNRDFLTYFSSDMNILFEEPIGVDGTWKE